MRVPVACGIVFPVFLFLLYADARTQDLWIIGDQATANRRASLWQR